MKKKYRIILFFVLGFSYSTELFAQNIETMLNNIGSVFSTKEESLYDEAENYLLSINKDSVEANINYELLYHIDMASVSLALPCLTENLRGNIPQAHKPHSRKPV